MKNGENGRNGEEIIFGEKEEISEIVSKRRRDERTVINLQKILKKGEIRKERKVLGMITLNVFRDETILRQKEKMERH